MHEFFSMLQEHFLFAQKAFSDEFLQQSLQEGHASQIQSLYTFSLYSGFMFFKLLLYQYFTINN